MFSDLRCPPAMSNDIHLSSSLASDCSIRTSNLDHKSQTRNGAKENDSETDNTQDCHCHLGHIHLAVLYQIENIFSADTIALFSSFAAIHSDQSHFFHSEINRPPIS